MEYRKGIRKDIEVKGKKKRMPQKKKLRDFSNLFTTIVLADGIFVLIN